MWKSYDTEFQGTLQSLRRHKDLVERRASVTQYQRYKEDMDMLKVKLAEQVEAEKLKKLVVIREWLAVGQQPIDEHYEYMKIRQKYSATTRWILERDAVKNWTQDINPASPCMCIFAILSHTTSLTWSLVLWIHGIPGAGEQILS
jgi:hypothetical protein